MNGKQVLVSICLFESAFKYSCFAWSELKRANCLMWIGLKPLARVTPGGLHDSARLLGYVYNVFSRHGGCSGYHCTDNHRTTTGWMHVGRRRRGPSVHMSNRPTKIIGNLHGPESGWIRVSTYHQPFPATYHQPFYATNHQPFRDIQSTVPRVQRASLATLLGS